MKRGVIVIDITGLQSEDMQQTLDVIRALHNRAIYYNNLNYVSVDDDDLEKIYENQIDG